jgi:hypothetical protein
MVKCANILRQPGIRLAFESTIAKCSCSFFFISREGRISMRRKIPGNLSFCEFYSLLNYLLLSFSQIRKAQKKGPITRRGLPFCWLLFIISFLLLSRKGSPEAEVSLLGPPSVFILTFSSLHSQFVILTPYQRQGHGCESPRFNSYNDFDNTFH